MDDKINTIKNKLDDLKYKYPNIVGMWESYINIRTKKLNETIETCLIVLNKLDNGDFENDIPKDVIYFMYLLSNTI
jgi:hypothetical protein